MDQWVRSFGRYACDIFVRGWQVFVGVLLGDFLTVFATLRWDWPWWLPWAFAFLAALIVPFVAYHRMRVALGEPPQLRVKPGKASGVQVFVDVFNDSTICVSRNVSVYLCDIISVEPGWGSGPNVRLTLVEGVDIEPESRLPVSLASDVGPSKVWFGAHPHSALHDLPRQAYFVTVQWTSGDSPFLRSKRFRVQFDPPSVVEAKRNQRKIKEGK